VIDTERWRSDTERGDHSMKSVELWLDPDGQVVMCTFDSPKAVELRAGDCRQVGRAVFSVFEDKKEAEPE
jgi:hypothetical protein